jgi:hypothetical protein
MIFRQAAPALSQPTNGGPIRPYQCFLLGAAPTFDLSFSRNAICDPIKMFGEQPAAA